MMHLKLGATLGALALCVLGLVFAVQAPAATLSAVNVATEGEVTRIAVTIDELVDFDHFTLENPSRLVVDCIGVNEVTTEMPAGVGLASSIQADIWKGAGDHAVTRLMINLDSPGEAEVTQTENGLVITLSPGDGEWTQAVPEVSEDNSSEWDTSDAFGLTDAENDFEFANTEDVRPMYKTQYSRGDEEVVTSFMVNESSGLGAGGGPRVSLDVQGADIYTVLRSISEYSGTNIVMGYDVRAAVNSPVSFHMENVPWGNALEMVLRSSHLWYAEEDGIIRVDTEDNLRSELLKRGAAQKQLEDVMPLSTRIVNVIYANGNELKEAVKKSLSGRGLIEVDFRTNALIVTDIPSRVDEVADMIQHLDTPTPQVEIVAKLVEVDARHTQELGVLWGGSNFHGNGVTSNVDLGSNPVVNPTGKINVGVVKDWGMIDAALAALEQDQKANIISNPRITTVNNREARILVGQKIPLIVLDEAGNSVTQLITIGITLLVNPHINDDNFITLDMHPEVSDLASQATVQGGVIINTAEADTRVMVANGETAVIGGLIRSNESVLTRGVPILKDIPILGALFRSESTVKEKRELLIFVTPRIVNSFAQAGENH